MNKYYLSLQIDTILEKITFYLHTEEGQKLFSNVQFINNYLDFKDEHDLLKDGIECGFKYGNIPFQNLKSYLYELKYAEKGGALSINAFKAIYDELNTVSLIKKYVDNIDGKYKYLIELCKDLIPLPDVIASISNVFDNSFEIKDSASSKLNTIRKSIIRTQNSLKNTILKEVGRYGDYLTEPTYMVRNESYVLPVKTSMKSRVPGIALDISGSGETTFIEPESILILLNDLLKLRNDEKEEIIRILEELTAFIMTYKSILKVNSSIVARLDIINAKISYAKDIDGNVIETLEDTHINLVKARHPLIDKTVVVSNTIQMDDSHHILIVSGPNAGGKSVLLKMTGLLILMNQMLIPLPVDETSSIGFFNRVYVDIGDVQSIQENLSTFSGHITNVINITNQVTNKDIVLIDELGTGTDPKEGEALAISICDYLNKKGCKSLITSHFDGVKKYALSHEGALCASMDFDTETITPKFKLRLDVPGSSYGISIAKKFGMNKTILNDANNIYNSGTTDDDKYIENLVKKMNSIDALILENNTLKEELEKEKSKLIEQLKIYNEKIKNFNEEMSLEKEKILKDTLQEIKDLKKMLMQKGTLTFSDINNTEKSLLELIDEAHYEEVDESVDKKEPINVGDYVYFEDFDVEAKVTKISKNGVTIMTKSKKTYVTSLENLTKINEPTEIKQPKINKVDYMILQKPLSYQLNLIGLHVNEAEQELDSYIVNAFSRKAKQVRIVHGYGTGALRKLVHEYLKNSKYVKSFRLGGEGEGGSGATIVELK